MTPFSDDDLKRLKDHCLEPHIGADVLDFYRIEALLARLEAAEKVCKSCEMEMMEKLHLFNLLKNLQKKMAEILNLQRTTGVSSP